MLVGECDAIPQQRDRASLHAGHHCEEMSEFCDPRQLSYTLQRPSFLEINTLLNCQHVLFLQNAIIQSINDTKQELLEE